MKEQEIELLQKDQEKITEPIATVAEGITESKQQSPQPPKKIFFGQAIYSSVTFGLANFLIGYMTAFDFATTFLSFSGFPIVVVIYKIIMARSKDGGITKRSVLDQFIGQYYDLETKAFNTVYLFNAILRAGNITLSYLLTVQCIRYAFLAQVNFGIITSCFCTSIVVNTFGGALLFHEKLSKKAFLGIVLIAIGIVWISIDKGDQTTISTDQFTTEEERDRYKVISIVIAILVGFCNAMQTIHSKFMVKLYKIEPIPLVSDGILIFSIEGAIITLINYLNDHPSVTLHNLFISFVATINAGISMFVSMNALTKGQAGPTSAIVYTQNFTTTLLQIIFMGLIPTISQLLATLIAFAGIVIMMIFK